MQLNVSNWRGEDYEWKPSVPDGVSEVILQQRSYDDCQLYHSHQKAQGAGRDFGDFVMLMDTSGGLGMFMGTPEGTDLPYVGCAGGLNAENVCGVVRELNENPLVHDYWIDMEAGVRDEEDWFSVDACERVLTALRG